jgi:hypothetical protein
MTRLVSSFRSRTSVAALTASALLCALAISASAASAAPTWQFGTPILTQIESCSGSGNVLTGAIIQAGVYYDNANPPKAGDVFYVGVQYEGTDPSCSFNAAAGDIGLPLGTKTAIDAANPITCFQWTADAPAPVADDPGLCVTQLYTPMLGGSGSIAPRDINGDPGYFDISYGKAHMVAVPVVANAAGVYDFAFPTREVSNSPTGGDQTMTVHETVNVVAGSTPPPNGQTISNILVPKSTKLKSGVSFSCTLGKKSDIKLTLQVKSHKKKVTVGSWSSKGHAAGPVAAKIKIAKKYKKYFKAKKTKATLVVKVTPSSGAVVTKTYSVTIAR